MSGPLVHRQNPIEGRLRRLQQKLNNELGFRDQRLRFKKVGMRSGPINWNLTNTTDEAAGHILPHGGIAELAAATNDQSILYFGYNEEWQPAQRGGNIEFVSSNLRFVISGFEDMPDLRFRLEWAGAKTVEGTVCYPGVGAAHPHWQFDVDEGWTGLGPRDHESDVPIKVDLETAPEEIDLAEDGEIFAFAPTPRRVSATLAAFHHLHLPARTMWHDCLCEMPDVASPQQHTPTSEDEIDRWVVSALRYMKSEFESYL